MLLFLSNENVNLTKTLESFKEKRKRKIKPRKVTKMFEWRNNAPFVTNFAAIPRFSLLMGK